MSTLIREELASRMWQIVLLAMLCIASSCVLGQAREGEPLWQTERTQEKLPSADQVIKADVVRVDVPADAVPDQAPQPIGRDRLQLDGPVDPIAAVPRVGPLRRVTG